MERLIRIRTLRLALAAILVVVGLWAFIPYLTYRVAPSAFVNAELTRVTAPFAGQLLQHLPRKGEYIDAARTVDFVELRAPDRRQVVGLEQQLSLATTRMELAQKQLAELKEADRVLAIRTEDHRKAMLVRLARAVEESDAKRVACAAEESERRKSRARVESLSKTGAVSASQIDEAESSHRSTIARCQAADAQLARLRSELDAAQKGIFLQDGYSDTPYSQQQRDRLMLRRQEVEAEMLRERAVMQQTEINIQMERERIREASRAELLLPAGHIVWTTMASPGSAVVEAQPVMDLASCHNRFVVVELAERDLVSVRSGDEAQVRLIGEDDWIVGRVQQLRGSAARADERLFAAQVPRPSERSVMVEIALPFDARTMGAERFCDIGRLAEVWLGRRSFDPIGLISRSFSRLTESLGLSGVQLASKTVQHGR